MMIRLLSLCLLLCNVSIAYAAEFELFSHDIAAGKSLTTAQVFKGFGCEGKNLSPHLKWKNPPSETKSFAVTVYDPDAPTGSGWWHWVLVNVPQSTNELETGVGSVDGSKLPEGAQQFNTDFGVKAFGGACPPEGHSPHRYQFKVFALNVEKLDLPSDATAALVGYYLHAHAIDTAEIEALYQR